MPYITKYLIALLSLLVACIPSIVAQRYYPQWDNIQGNRQSRLVWHYKTSYDPNGNLVQIDSTYYAYSGDHSWSENDTAWRYDYRKTATGSSKKYYLLNKLIDGEDFFTDGVAVPTNSIEYWYTNERRTSELYWIWSSSASVPVRQKDYFYDGTGTLIGDSMTYSIPAAPAQKRVFTYSADGITKIVSWQSSGTSLIQTVIEDIVYKQKKKTEHNFNTYDSTLNQWIFSKREIYSYSNNLLTSLTVVTRNLSKTLDTTIENYHYNAVGDIDTVTVYDIKNRQQHHSKRMLMTYNVFHQPLTVTRQRWDISTGGWTYNDAGENDSYQYFEFGLFADGTKANDELIKIYPIPAKNNLYVEYSFERIEKLYFSISSLDGKTITEWTEQTKKGRSLNSVDISRLTSGSYILRINNGDKIRAKKFEVIR
ncbi:MAG: T9SS type A sorting domain-containing protein [Sphingobacteriales bacterium]|nr:MAG: T9SS type A sorting domain-containing protein [Sphingobacteriales bacterium]